MAAPAVDGLWLPDLCRLRRLLTMLGLAQLTVLVVLLAPNPAALWDLSAFVSASGYALWLALSVSVLLCACRRPLSRFPVRIGAVVAVALAMAVAVMASAIVHGLFASVREAALPGFGRFVGGSGPVVGLLTGIALRYFSVIDRWQGQVAAHARAEADALQARIRPHFLFNSMNMIATLLRRDPVVAERAVLDLSDLFRAALGAGEGTSTLAEEVSLAERYLSIEQLRLGDRLQVNWHTQRDLPWTLPMPRLVLQPVLENAVLHGISRLPEGGTIDVHLTLEAGVLGIEVANPSLPPDDAPAQGAGHAQRSIAQRLGFAFGPRARMRYGWNGGRYACTIQVPVPTDGAAPVPGGRTP
ncbi:histidine kinase [Luteimonas sp. 3794]|uniref:sensor histidine kinase n=1 Tax=Luteimonas sp. 3794 TaxID=2817730 RepID=UPI002864FCAC|nr:histidine kinase [Luteimonas sp. 3794]MDR6991731.1 two-component system sensor histidine kinase AlgZ [Luteimonas sp. 3794]